MTSAETFQKTGGKSLYTHCDLGDLRTNLAPLLFSGCFLCDVAVAILELEEKETIHMVVGKGYIRLFLSLGKENWVSGDSSAIQQETVHISGQSTYLRSRGYVSAWAFVFP